MDFIVGSPHAITGNSSIARIGAGIIALIVSWLLYTVIYNLLISPLSRFPGPKLWAISRIPSQLSVLRGHTHLEITALFDRYGPVVRTGPNELAFNTPGAFRDIYGSRPGHKPFPKDRSHYVQPPNGVDHVDVAVDDAVHTRQRKLLAPAFSERAVKDQEVIVQSYIDLLIDKLRSQVTPHSNGAHSSRKSASSPSTALDIKSWLNYTTFDITGDLMFGESFDCLRDSHLHPWIELIFDSIKSITLLGVINQFPWASSLLQVMLPKSVMQKGIDHFNMAARKADRRLEMGTERLDFMSAILKHGLADESKEELNTKGAGILEDGEGGTERRMTRAEIHSNALIIIIAGSETSATLLSGAIFLLCTHPAIHSGVTSEVRSTFPDEDGERAITFARTARLPFLNAVIEESLRMYPPFVTSLARVTPKGRTVDEWVVPEGTIVACHHYASYHSRSNFFRPDDFVPERWLNDDNDGSRLSDYAANSGFDPTPFRADRRDVLNPFSLGPRNCIGKTLAYAEIRLILTKLLWHFDIELCPESKNWIGSQEVYALWDKPPLWVKLKERERKI